MCRPPGRPYVTGPFRSWKGLDRAGLTMTYHGTHRPLTAYTAAMEAAGLAIETIREPLKTTGGKKTMPFLHLLARRAKP